jgi:hypothetical protein
MDSTPVSLLDRLRRPTDQPAWDRFVQLTPAAVPPHRLVPGGMMTCSIFTFVHKLPELRHGTAASVAGSGPSREQNGASGGGHGAVPWQDGDEERSTARRPTTSRRSAKRSIGST